MDKKMSRAKTQERQIEKVFARRAKILRNLGISGRVPKMKHFMAGP